MSLNYLQGMGMTYRKYYDRFNDEKAVDYAKRMDSEVTALESLSENHLRWYTHKNPRGCWICDLLFLTRKIVIELGTELDRLDKGQLTLNMEESFTEADKANV